MTRTATAAAVAALFLLGACSSGSDNDAAETPADDPTLGSIPAPSEAEATELVDELAAIDLALADEPDDTVDLARNTCDGILNDSQTLQQSTVVRFDVDEDQAQQILDVIQAQPWCA